MTADLVHDHHPDDDQLSMHFVNPDWKIIENRLETYGEATETRVRSYDLDEEVYVIYAKTNEVDDTEKIEYDLESAFAEMDSDTRVVVRYLLDVFEGIQEKSVTKNQFHLTPTKGSNSGGFRMLLRRSIGRGQFQKSEDS